MCITGVTRICVEAHIRTLCTAPVHKLRLLVYRGLTYDCDRVAVKMTRPTYRTLNGLYLL
jgi:hypothetical protein